MTHHKQSLRELLQPSYKKNLDPLSEWYLIRWLSFYITRVFIFLRINATGATLLGVFLSILSAISIIKASPALLFLGLCLFVCGCIFDCVDGELARYHNTSSVEGVYLDSIAGDINDFLLISSLSIAIPSLTGQFSSVWFLFTSLSILFLRTTLRNSYWSTIGLQFNRVSRGLQPSELHRKKLNTSNHFKSVKKPLIKRILMLPTESFFHVVLLLISSFINLVTGNSFFLLFFFSTYLLSLLLITTLLFYKHFINHSLTHDYNEIIGFLPTSKQ